METFQFRRSDGMTVDLPVATARRGLFAPPVSLTVINDPNRRGGHVSKRAVLSRVAEFRCVVADDDPLVVRAKLRELAAAFDDDPEAGTIICQTSDEQELHLTRVTYQSGLEVEDNRARLQPLVLQFLAADPDWYLPDEHVTEFILGGTATSFLPIPSAGGNFTELSESDITSTKFVNNAGDLDVWPVWEITGPGENPSITHAETGHELSLTVTMDAGEVITIDTASGQVRDPAGANLFGLVDRPVNFWSIPAGGAMVTVTVTDADAGTRVAARLRPKKRTI